MRGIPRIRSIVGLDAIRALRAEVVAMAAALEREPSCTQLLCLVSPRMTVERLAEEWRIIERILQPAVVKRLAVHAMLPDGRCRTFGEITEPLAARLCRDVSSRENQVGTIRLPPPDYSFLVLKLFVYSWLTHRGPVTARWLADTAGCSYPTVASATRHIGRAVVKRPDRRLELREFPRHEWSRLLVVAEAARFTMRFADRSGQPRSAARLAERLQELRPDAVAIGGVLGARRYEPELDLMGLPQEKRDTFVKWAMGLLHSQDREVAANAMREIAAYLAQVIREKSENPDGRVISTIAHARPDGVPLTEREVFGFVFFLFIGGLDTVFATLNNIWLWLANNPDRRREMINDPGNITAQVEELLRVYSVTFSHSRVLPCPK